MLLNLKAFGSLHCGSIRSGSFCLDVIIAVIALYSYANNRQLCYNNVSKAVASIVLKILNDIFYTLLQAEKQVSS